MRLGARPPPSRHPGIDPSHLPCTDSGMLGRAGEYHHGDVLYQGFPCPQGGRYTCRESWAGNGATRVLRTMPQRPEGRT